ncbi:hypothetical protein FQR65_LT09633 [Abscondita terminalis]|nr:hypothetical protein FQR65_LT09633 [Abscondita terminalis]
MNSAFEKPSKPKRKKRVDVPVHRAQPTVCDENEHKVYSAQFNGKRKIRCKDNQNDHIQTIYTHSNESVDYKLHLKKKILHLKEKLNGLKVFNEEVLEENNQLKSHYQHLLNEYEKCREELNQDKECDNCEFLKRTLEKSTDDYNKLKTSNQQLIQDMNMLKNVVYRLNVHMERYQEKLRKYNISAKYISKSDVIDAPNSLELATTEAINSLSKEHLAHAHTPISWGSVNSHTLGPLLDAYQETLDEKEEIIQSYEIELSHFKGKLQEIVDENEKLHKRLTEDDECSAKLSVELDKLKTDLKSTRNENDLLIKNALSNKLNWKKFYNVTNKRVNNIQNVSNLSFKNCLVEQLRRDYNVVVEQYHKSRSEIAALKEKNQSLIDSHDEFKNEKQNYISLSMHNSSVNECKKKDKIEENATLLQNQINDLNKNVTILKVEKEELENKLKSIEKRSKKLESKNADLQTSFEEMQCSRNACRKQLHKAMTFAKELVTEQEKLLHSLHLRQQENKVVKQIGSDIATRMDSLKNQLKTVQRDAWQELSTVEQKIHNQDSIINELKREHSEEVERLKEIIRKKEQKNVLLKNSDASTPLPHCIIHKNINLE